MSPWRWVEQKGESSGSLGLSRSSTGTRRHLPWICSQLTELAWHDCYGEVTPPREVIEGMLTVSGGSIEGLIQAALLAVTDSRDLKVAEEGRLHPK